MKTFNTVAIETDIHGVDSNEELISLFVRALELCQTGKTSPIISSPWPSNTSKSSENVTYFVQHAESVNLTPAPLPEVHFQECLHGMQAIIRHITHKDEAGMEKTVSSGHVDGGGEHVSEHGFEETSKFLNRPLTTCSDEERVKCSESDRVYTSQNAFSQHIKSHETPALEGKNAVNESESKDKHTKTGLNCTHCGKIYTSQGPFKKHLTKHKEMFFVKDSVGDENQETMQEAHTTECNMTGNSSFENHVKQRVVQQENDEHLQTHAGKKIHQCQVCEKIFKTKSYLGEHMRIHTGERPHKCKHCNMAFVNKGNLNKHIQIHTGEKRHKCEVCDQAFIGKYDIVRHMRIHTGERPYQCGFCDKGFIRKEHLARHLPTHNDERPHKCDSCDKTFKRKEDLGSHFRIHTGDRPHKCEVCDKAFLRKQRLVIHMRTHTHS